MKQILPELKNIQKHLNFAKKAFTKRGFRHVTHYINGLITLNRKSIKRISQASIHEHHHSAINRLLVDARFEQELLEQRYLKKIKYLTKGHKITLMFDDTLVQREGKKIEEAQSHKDHCTNGFVRGHQFFTAYLHTPLFQLPLFPKLFSKQSESKIQMASDLLDRLLLYLNLNTVLFDSWYSDHKLINKCTTKYVRVICGIKTNRQISLKKGNWQSLASFSHNTRRFELTHYYIDEIKYKIGAYRTKLHSIRPIKLLVSYEWNEKENSWSDPFHLISTNTHDSVVKIIRHYRIRWFIETFHRDIKQNLGFAQVFVRKKEGIVRHAIYVTLAYVVLKLFMKSRGMDMTIGMCCSLIQNQGMDDFIREIIEIDDKETRLNYFEEVFIRKTAKI